MKHANKYRISKKTLSQMPAEVAEHIKAIGDDYGIKSFYFNSVAAGHSIYHAEGGKYTYIYGNDTLRMEMVSENSLGASGMRHEIGARVSIPSGTTAQTKAYCQRYTNKRIKSLIEADQYIVKISEGQTFGFEKD
jgi:hypothetical protein